MSPETPFAVWPCDEKRRHERCKACNNNEGGREETSRKAQTEVDGPSAERFETTPAQPKAGTEPRRMEKGNHGDQPRTGIRSAKVRKRTHYHMLYYLTCIYIRAGTNTPSDEYDSYREYRVANTNMYSRIHFFLRGY